MRILFVALAAMLAGCASLTQKTDDGGNLYADQPIRSQTESEQRRPRVDNFRTGTIWLQNQPCQSITTTELAPPQSAPYGIDTTAAAIRSAQAALDICAHALSQRIVWRLDARGDLATISALGAIGALTSASAPAATTNFWIGVGVLPTFYENLQSSRMIAIEYYSTYGVSWIREQSDFLLRDLNALDTTINDLNAAMASADRAADAITGQLECVNAEIANTRMRAGSPLYVRCHGRAALASAREGTKAQLESALAQLETVQAQARRMRSAAMRASALRGRIPTWTMERFERLRNVALGQQIVSRVGPGEAFREIIATPFGVIASSIRGTSTADLPRLIVQTNIKVALATLPERIGVQEAQFERTALTFDRAKVGNATRANEIAAQVSRIRELVDATEATSLALAALSKTDGRAIVTLDLPTS